MNEMAAREGAMTGDEGVEVPDVRTAYDAFNVIWSKVARSVRAETENQQRMRVVRAYFDSALAVEAEQLEEAKRARTAEEALAAVTSIAKGGEANEGAATTATEEEPPSMLHVALRVLRTLSRPEWEMAKAIVELHKFGPDELMEVLSEIQETHCPDCAAWLDDDDEHADCPGRSEEELPTEGSSGPMAENAAPGTVSAASVMDPPVPAIVADGASMLTPLAEETAARSDDPKSPT